VGHSECKFQMERDVAHQPLLVSKIKVIALSCDVKIYTVHRVVLSQSTRVTDRWMNKIMTPKTVLA